MASLIPIPTTRVSNLLIRERLLSQLQGDQLDIFRLQNQVSTGRRITRPSEDAPAAQRAMTLQRLLERKSQLKVNIETGNSFLAATDSALSDVAGTLGDIRGLALGVAGTTSSDEQRQVVAIEVNRALEQLVQTANRNFRGRFLFSGSQTNVQPYSLVDGYVHYAGNNKSVNNFSDIDVLFSTNAAGHDVFGGISSAVVAGQNLNPQLTSDTLLTTLRGGRGISPNGALLISDGVHSSVVDVSKAATIGDVARFIEQNPPAGRTVKATVTATGLTLQLDSSGGGSLTVSEVGSGKTASELGILETSGVLTNPLVGRDLDPAIIKTTRLDDLIGARARARVSSPGVNNDLLIEAAANGAQYNNVTVQFVDSELLNAGPGVAPGNEYAQYDASARAATASLEFAGAGNDLILTATTAGTTFNGVRISLVGQAGKGDAADAVYDSLNKRLTITVDDSGATTIDKVLNAINAEGTFTAAHDPTAEGAGNYNGTALVDSSDVGVLQGDTGNSGGGAGTLFVFVANGVSTANQVAQAINNEGTFTAAVDQSDATSLGAAGAAAVDLDSTATTTGGVDGTFDRTAGIRVVNGGQTYTLDFAAAETVEDVLNVINGSDGSLYAAVNADGTGIDVRSRLSGGDFQIGENGGQTATQLGIRSLTGDTDLAGLNYGVGVVAIDSKTPIIASQNLELRTRSGASFTVDLSAATTINAVRDAINAVTGASVTASVASGQLTLVDNTAGPGQLDVIQSGSAIGITGGVPATVPTFEFSITPRSGVGFNVDVSGSGTIQDVIDRINAASGGSVTARLATTGNGIEIVDNSSGSGQLTVDRAEGSEAAIQLGLIPEGQASASAASGTLRGSDQKFYETSSVFTTLTRLRDALQSNDINKINQAISSIDGDIDRVTFARSDVGARQQALELSKRTLQDEDVQLQAALSSEVDIDLVEAISNLVARQSSLEASLRTTASILQLSLLNFL